MGAELSAARMRALRRVTRGGVMVMTHDGVAPYAVAEVIPGAGVHTRVTGLHDAAVRELREAGLITWIPLNDTFGPWPLVLTQAGQELIRGG